MFVKIFTAVVLTSSICLTCLASFTDIILCETRLVEDSGRLLHGQVLNRGWRAKHGPTFSLRGFHHSLLTIWKHRHLNCICIVLSTNFRAQALVNTLFKPWSCKFNHFLLKIGTIFITIWLQLKWWCDKNCTIFIIFIVFDIFLQSFLTYCGLSNRVCKVHYLGSYETGLKKFYLSNCLNLEVFRNYQKIKKLSKICIEDGWLDINVVLRIADNNEKLPSYGSNGSKCNTSSSNKHLFGLFWPFKNIWNVVKCR